MQQKFDLGPQQPRARPTKHRSVAPRPRSVNGERQPCLPGLEIDRLDNLLFGICPDDDEALCVQNLTFQLRNEWILRGESLGEKCFHLSLFGLGIYHTVPRFIVDSAHEAARKLKMQRFEITFDRVMSFQRTGGKQPFVLRCGKGSDELRAFRHELGRAMSRNDLHKHVRGSFTPHVTMLYDWKTVPEQKIEPIVWKVRSFVLIHSLHGFHRHDHLEHWQLDD